MLGNLLLKLFLLFSLLFTTSVGFGTEKPLSFNHESELSIITTGGNSDLQTYNGKVKNILNHRKNKYELSGHYTYGTSEGIESARNWSALFRYDRFLRENELSLFAAEKVEGNKFQGLESRYNTDLGVSYRFFQTERSTLLSEVGYRYTYERSTDPDQSNENFQKGRVYLEYHHKLREGVTLRKWVEYIPNFTESKDYQLSFSPSLRVAINNLFSLAVSYRGDFDNEPTVAGKRRYDYTYTTSLIASF